MKDTLDPKRREGIPRSAEGYRCVCKTLHLAVGVVRYLPKGSQ